MYERAEEPRGRACSRRGRGRSGLMAHGLGPRLVVLAVTSGDPVEVEGAALVHELEAGEVRLSWVRQAVPHGAPGRVVAEHVPDVEAVDDLAHLGIGARVHEVLGQVQLVRRGPACVDL